MKNKAAYASVMFEAVVMVMSNNGNRTVWSPIQSVII